MKNSLLLIVAAMVAGVYHQSPQDYVTILQKAFDNEESGIQVQGEGIVIQLLSDDLEEPRHQRFIIRVSPKQTLLVAHNIDIAERVPGLQENSAIEFYGEYEWNVEGGVIHWTHHDPDADHIDGWLKYDGKTYQ
ncbi:MAG: DUF3465 domain-containing protein [Candidatus Electrothrix sp. AUS1_2]|nr:DUF3465 domain-containing protein [Candidatus Electrothrix sp. AUS1_2]